MPYKDNEKQKQYLKDWRIRCAEARRCVRCGLSLVEGEGKCCTNCSSRTTQAQVSLNRTMKGVLYENITTSEVTK